ncbi:hypothetical protein MKK88_16075 [Methylobacterium sp. E-005]|uniref:hypothetical protein n=1 Tax=Methylobacterium sp. E-005 TaxID=2836549 RepID=UPI001FBA52F5|nr:hypothetical protein [Methylobacterium sp. E-005]MCJ2087486.1 hypothetical protein [Methylobacterium sp. E-005]
MTNAPQNVPIERVNWVRRDGGELVISLVTMGRSLAFGFQPEAAQMLLEGIVEALREQVDEAIPMPPVSASDSDGSATS